MDSSKKEHSVKALYEKYPYPARENITKEGVKGFAEWVAATFGEKNSFWKGKSVLELGCGTGELAVGLALCGAKVTAIDFSPSSITKAKKLALKMLRGTGKAKFFCKNILELKENELDKKFDAVLAIGSLHHTIDARKGFAIACENLLPGGTIVVGLYNKYGRLRHRAKRILLRAFCGADIEKRIAFGEKWFGKKGPKTWSADKYGSVHESYHSVSQVLKWFREEGIEFTGSRPGFKTPVIDEVKWLFEKRGAFFVMAGKKQDL